MDTEPLKQLAKDTLDKGIEIARPLTQACCRRDGKAVLEIANAFIDQHSDGGAFVVASVLAAAFASFTGLDQLNETLSEGANVLARLDFPDHQPVFPEPGIAQRIKIASRFVERYLADRDDLSYMAIVNGETDVAALVKGLCELVAATADDRYQ